MLVVIHRDDRIEVHQQFAPHKLKHWRAFHGIFALKAAPMLVLRVDPLGNHCPARISSRMSFTGALP